MKRIGPKILTVCMMLYMTSSLSGQDIHFTNNMVVPTYYNPAQTGAYSGTYRAGLIIRDQWRPSANLPFTSGALFVDSPIIFGFTKQQWLGVGATLFYDRAGDVRQTWSGFYPGVAYHIGLDKKFKNVVTLGVQYGFGSRAYDTTNHDTEHTLGGGTNDPDLNRIGGPGSMTEFEGSYSDLNIGVMYKGNPDKRSKIEIGAAYMHVLNPGLIYNTSEVALPDTSFTSPQKESNIGGRINLHTVYRRAISKKTIIEPSAFVSLMPSGTNINAQVRTEYLLKKGGDLSLIGGLGMRFGDAIQLLMGANYKDYVISFSYDHTITDHGGYTGAYELGVTRIFLVNKKPKVKPIIYCPRL